MRRLLVAGVVSLAAAACGPSRGELIVDWTFAGQNCQAAGVATISFSIPNEVLSPDHYACVTSNQVITGADLGSYVPGDYQVTVTGLDAAGNTIYQGTQMVRVAGGRQNEYAIDTTALVPVGGSTAEANLTWVFSNAQNPNISCAQAGVTDVEIFVDPNPDGSGGTSAGKVACSTAGAQDASISPLSEGTHSFAIAGSNAGHLLYATHHPVSATFRAGYVTDVTVSAESPP